MNLQQLKIEACVTIKKLWDGKGDPQHARIAHGVIVAANREITNQAQMEALKLARDKFERSIPGVSGHAT